MSIASGFRSFYFAYLSKPRADRVLYRVVRRRRVRQILELGIGTATRARRMIEVASACASPKDVRYTGIDLFEAQASGQNTGLSLKAAHQVLKRTGATIRLCPGDPCSALARVANDLGQVDLVVVSAGVEPSSMERAWRFVPRLLHGASLVFVETELSPNGARALRCVRRREIDALASAATLRRAA